MPDVFTRQKRSEVMSQIRSRGNKDTEILLVSLLRKHRITGWRRNQRMFGMPDFVFRKSRLAVFVDGCFWHSCPKPKHSPRPKTRRAWWKRKLERNQARDKTVNRTLCLSGWRVLRIWEHELRNGDAVVKRLRRVLQAARSGPRSTTRSSPPSRRRNPSLIRTRQRHRLK